MQGKPYDRKTFKETVDTVAFSSESEDSDDEEIKEKYKRRHGEFTLGSACASYVWLNSIPPGADADLISGPSRAERALILTCIAVTCG